MTKKHRHFYLVLPSLVLILAVLACGTGYRTTYKFTEIRERSRSG